MPVMTPWATMPNTAALMPTVVRVAIPSITKPMWPTEEYAISRLMSRWARQQSDPYRIATTARTPMTGAQVRAASGRIGRAMRTNP